MTTYIAIFFCLLVISYSSFGDNHQSTLTVQVLHFIKSPDWGIAINGDIPCSCCTTCKWFSSYNIDELKEKSKNDIRLSEDSHYLIKVAVYNIHSWKEMGNHTGYPYGPSKQLITNLTLVESEESFSRFPKLFQTSFKFYDGYSTSHPNADVPRYYEEAILNPSQFIPRIPYSKAVKAAVYVTSTCHRRGTALRDRLVNALGKYIRVDSIGSCLKSPKYNDTVAINESIGDRLLAKRIAISNYLFYLAFENTIEPGYVTEKVFDGLHAGTVPVYLGAEHECRKLLPHPNSVIFTGAHSSHPSVSAPNLAESLGPYLKRVSENETLYETFRAWRDLPLPVNPLLSQSWPCNVCCWAVRKLSAGKK